MDIENEIQSWIAVRSFAVEDANPQAPIIDANELAEFVTEVFKKLEGCVVVPVQCPDPDFADSLFDELSKKAIGEFGDDLLIHFSDIDEEKIWALMVEAAKAQAVPEGYVLVDAESLVLHARSIRIFNTGEQYSKDIEDHVCSINLNQQN